MWDIAVAQILQEEHLLLLRFPGALLQPVCFAGSHLASLPSDGMSCKGPVGLARP